MILLRMETLCHVLWIMIIYLFMNVIIIIQQWLVIANFSASAVDLPEGLAREGRVVIHK